MSEAGQKTVVYLTELTHQDDGLVVKYVGPKNRQFREAYCEMADDLHSVGLEMAFAEIKDLTPEGVLLTRYRIVSNDNDVLTFEEQPGSFTPRLIMNRRKDALYTHPAYARLVKEGAKFINEKEIAQLGDKADSRQKLGQFMPPSALLTSDNETERQKQLIDFIRRNGMTVVKPLRLNGAADILFVANESDGQVQQIARSTQPFILQQYIETKEGVEGFVKGRHDVRIFVCGGTMLAGAVRQPKEGSLVSNTAQGGAIEFYELKQLPESLKKYCREVIDVLEISRYSFVSFDFFYGNGRWYLIEVNDQPGTPANYQNKAVAQTIRSSLVALYKEGLQ